MPLRDDDGNVTPMLRAFETHGVDWLREVTGGNAVGTCPFCGKDKFYANMKTGLWDCKGKECQADDHKGNTLQFLEFVAAFYPGETTAAQYRKLSEQRGISTKRLVRRGLSWNGDEWIIPVRKGTLKENTVVDLRRWKPPRGRVMTTPGCKVFLFGGHRLKGAKNEVWLCEGEWDAMALEDLKPPGVVVSVPGANIFKKEWPALFRDKAVHVIYDADQAGDEGAVKVNKMLRSVVRSIDFMVWPENTPKGYDVRDFIADGATLDEIQGGLEPEPRRQDAEEEGDGGDGEDVPSVMADKPGEVLEISGVFRAFDRHFSMNSSIYNSIRVATATVLTTWIGGDPCWLFIVGPPGSMKSEVLMAFSTSPHAISKSSLTPRSLVSGWKGEDDPSLIARLNDRTLILKDWTEITSLHISAQEEIYGVLRGAFDGKVERDYGNGVTRKYDCHFQILAGSTPIIYGENRASLGERFLKYQLRQSRDMQREAVRAAIRGIGKEKVAREDVREAVRSLVAHLYGRFQTRPVAPELSDGTADRILAMAELAAFLRGEVDRDPRGEFINFKPQPEVGSRLGKQLAKLAMGLAMVDEEATVQLQHERLVRQVALDTARAFHANLFENLLSAPEEGHTLIDLQEMTGLPTSTLARRLEDLTMLGVLDRVSARRKASGPAVGRLAWRWVPMPYTRAIWAASLVPGGEAGQSNNKVKVRSKKKGGGLWIRRRR